MITMSGINRLLSRRDKNTHGDHPKKVMSSPVPTPPQISDSSSTSSSVASTGTFSPFLFPLSHGRTSSSSLSSFSLAFKTQTPKRSPSLQAIEGTIHASTANASEHLLLQPKQTSGHLHGLFPDEDVETPIKDDETKVHSQTFSKGSDLHDVDQSFIPAPCSCGFYKLQRTSYQFCAKCSVFKR